MKSYIKDTRNLKQKQVEVFSLWLKGYIHAEIAPKVNLTRQRIYQIITPLMTEAFIETHKKNRAEMIYKSFKIKPSLSTDSLDKV
jgi:predicted DNA-binding protein YlxM (UPF0122 family)